MKCVIDTNIVIYYFNGLTGDETIHELLTNSFNISIITKIEFLGWSKFATDAKLYDKACSFIRNAVVLDLNSEVAEKTIEIRQQQKIKKHDAIIGPQQ